MSPSLEEQVTQLQALLLNTFEEVVMPARALWLRSGGRHAGWGPPRDLGPLLSRLGSAWRGAHLSFVTAYGLHICHTVGVPHIWSLGPCELGADETEVGRVDTWGHSAGEWGAGIRTGSSAPRVSKWPCQLSFTKQVSWEYE